MKKIIIVTIGFLMFFFKDVATAKNERNFFDLQINNINGETINIDGGWSNA